MADTEKQPEEKTPETQEERFAKRYEAEKELEKSQDEERAYQLYRIKREFGLKDSQVAAWKDAWPLGVEFGWLRGKPYVWRVLSGGEYLALAEKSADAIELQKKVVATTLLLPAIGETDFVRHQAGLVQSLANAIYLSSGFDQVIPIPI